MTDNLKRINQQVTFIECLDRLKLVLRQNLVMDETRRENSAEHSWHIATMAMVMAEYAPHPVDLLRVIKMLLVHDVVEIEAGDTFCYDIAGNQDKEEREKQAALRLFGMLPTDQAGEFHALWDEFEEGETVEAGFANALDRFQVLLQNVNTRGGTWRIHAIEKARVLERMRPIRSGAPALWPLVESYLEQACATGILHE